MIVDPARGAELVRAGETVAYPTETVYGLAADARSGEAVARLRRLKGCGRDQGLSVLVDAPGRLDEWAPELPGAARVLAERYWPGPLTLVVPVPAGRLTEVSTPLGVGFRCSSHPPASELARRAGFPLIATSCNRSGSAPCADPAEIEDVFGPDLAIVVGSPVGSGPPSTVVAVSQAGDLELLRAGALPFDRILGGVAT